jgi:hypothetical protein
MYTATMVYEFKKGCLDSGVKIWKDIVLGAAQGQPGLIRMQLLVGSSKIMAQGSWEDESCAQKIYEDGYFSGIDGEAATFDESRSPGRDLGTGRGFGRLSNDKPKTSLWGPLDYSSKYSSETD